MDIFTPTHLLILLGIALLIFGPRRLPELGAGLGKSLKAFRDATSGAEPHVDTANAHGQEAPSPGAASPASSQAPGAP